LSKIALAIDFRGLRDLENLVERIQVSLVVGLRATTQSTKEQPPPNPKISQSEFFRSSLLDEKAQKEYNEN